MIEENARLDAALREVVASYAQPDQPFATFRAFDRVVEREIGRVFFTILKVEEDIWSRRIFTTVPNEYPLSGRKPLPKNPRTAEIYEGRKAYFAHGREKIEAEYPGHATVLGLGADTLTNIPVAFDGKVLGAANIGGLGWPDHAEVGRFLLPLAQALGPLLAMRS